MLESIKALAVTLHVPYEFVWLLLGFLPGLLLGRNWGRQPRDAVVESQLIGGLSESTAGTDKEVSLVVNGTTVKVAPQAMADIQTSIRAGDKTEAIKRLREASGLNLAAAKSVVESLAKVMGS